MGNIIKILATAALFAMVGCATTQPNDDQAVVAYSESEDFGSYIRLFQNEGADRGLTVDITGLRVYMAEFGKAMNEQGVIGLCSPEGDKQNIYISQKAWFSYDSLQREMLIFHEMGHCLLKQDHDKSMDKDAIPEDLMFPSNFESYFYNLNRSDYLDRMFNKYQELLDKADSDKKLQKSLYECQWRKMYRVPKEVEDDNRIN